MTCLCYMQLVGAMSVGKDTKESTNETAYEMVGVLDYEEVGVAKFGRDLMGELVKSEGDDKNVVISPLTVHMLLSMVYLGAGKNTMSQLKKGLELDWSNANNDDSLEGFRNMSEDYDKVSNDTHSGTQIRIANAMFVKDGLPVKHGYEGSLKNFIGASVQTFKSPQDGSGQLNAFVKSKTNGLIEKVIGPNDINANTLMILASACYFKSTWKTPFKAKKTQEMKFKLAGGKKTIQLEHGMRTGHKEKFRHAELEDGTRIIELPYQNPNFNMYIAMPKAGFICVQYFWGFSGLVFFIFALYFRQTNAADHHYLPFWEKVYIRIKPGCSPKDNTVEAINTLATSFNYDTFESKLRRIGDVFVQMPRFETGSSLTLNSALKAMGMTDMFGPKADLSRMLDGTNGQVSKVAHKTVVKVNEEGSEAAAVAVAIVSFRSMSTPLQINFIVDRPIVFMIHDKVNNAPIFVGRVMDPSPSSSN